MLRKPRSFSWLCGVVMEEGICCVLLIADVEIMEVRGGGV